MRAILVLLAVMSAGCVSGPAEAPPGKPHGAELSPLTDDVDCRQVFRMCERLLATDEVMEHNTLLENAAKAAPKSLVVALCVGRALDADETFGEMHVNRVMGGVEAAAALDPTLRLRYADRLIALARMPTNLRGGARTYYAKDIIFPALGAVSKLRLTPEQQLAVLRLVEEAPDYRAKGHVLFPAFEVLDSQTEVPAAVVEKAEGIAAPLDRKGHEYVHAVVARLRKRLSSPPRGRE